VLGVIQNEQWFVEKHLLALPVLDTVFEQILVAIALIRNPISREIEGLPR
jgi:hypothetical protein